MSGSLSANELPPLPEPVSNNAVAQVTTEQGTYLVSLMGLGAQKTHDAVHNRVWRLKLGEGAWQAGAPVPSVLPLKGRLAATATAMAGEIYLFGGYTVAEDHTEISAPDSYAYNPETDQYRRLADMPVAVDDSVALAYGDRYIYLVSGWHQDGNVNLVQLYDRQTDRWRQASPFPGAAVFGQAGALVGETMVICDGVKVVAQVSQRRRFAASPECHLGIINPADPAKIQWQALPHHSGTARYRMAAVADGNGVRFIGGSDNPYNYNGIGYNGTPAKPSDRWDRFDIDSGQWQSGQTGAQPTMDHRGALDLGSHWAILGGMGPQQKVLKRVTLVEKH
ncbi:galactose oxidase [Ferrimonas balearica]|nr:galactose oxidase [Ferrimonas balearica]